MQDFESMFEALTGNKPLSWQRRLASEQLCRSRLIRIPTGLGKTQGVLGTWAFHRLSRADDGWPRRLVWCLPMRVLVEQTYDVACRLASAICEANRPVVHISMGGEDAAEWFLYPERPAIIIGTQDMLLSRALNRGYASPRARWPMEFGLLSQDALWIMDEVQLMDVGLATSAQLQAYRDEDCQKGFRPCHTWWMSATLQPDWLRTVDTEGFQKGWIDPPCTVPAKERNGGLWTTPKAAAPAAIAPDKDGDFAGRVLEEHSGLADGEFGKITLVVCNTVERACRTFDALRKAGRTEGLELVHSRFRPAERENWRGEFLSRSACTSGVDRIIVATQVVEAGVDISAGCLVTELAPWPSLVQRFGRCARYGGSGSVLVVDRRGDGQGSAAPYQPTELESAWQAILELKDVGVGIAALEKYEDDLTPEQRGHLYTYSPAHLLLRKEFDDLFDTTPDLSGADVDISRFIRSGDERDLQVFWIKIEKGKKGESPKRPADDRQPNRRELCPVPFLKARDWLCGEETKTNRKSTLRGGMRAWVWDWLDGEWKAAKRDALLPGQIICVAADAAGYKADRGFSPDSSEPVTPVPPTRVDEGTWALDAADSQQNKEIAGGRWKTIACHTNEVVNEAGKIAAGLGLTEEVQHVLKIAAQWHDWGKCHPAFQGAMRGGRPAGHSYDLAKAPKSAWRAGATMYRYLDDSETRPAFRHELASALGLFAILQMYAPRHEALLGPWLEALPTLSKAPSSGEAPPDPSPLIQRVIDCSPGDFNLLVGL